MATRERPVDIGARRAVNILRALGDELHEARLECGMSQARLAAAVGIAQSKVSLIERHVDPSASVRHLSRLLAVVGLELSARAYPGGSPLIDVAQRKLLDRLSERTHVTLSWRFEVPLPIPGDQRAWDAVIEATGHHRIAVEAETRLRNLQALQRRLALKRRDDPSIAAVVLLVASTRANREVIRAEGQALAFDFPLAARSILALLGDGRLPDEGGIVVLETRNRAARVPG